LQLRGSDEMLGIPQVVCEAVAVILVDTVGMEAGTDAACCMGCNGGDRCAGRSHQSGTKVQGVPHQLL
jgi:hypothetical protein